MQTVPFNYGFVNIQLYSAGFPDLNSHSMNFQVDANNSEVGYEEIAKTETNVNERIIKKIKGYRVKLDLKLLSYHLTRPGEVNYGWQSLKNILLRYNKAGDVINNVEYWNQHLGDTPIEVSDISSSWGRSFKVSRPANSDRPMLYQRYYIRNDSRPFRFTVVAKAESGETTNVTLKIKEKWSDGNYYNAHPESHEIGDSWQYLTYTHTIQEQSPDYMRYLEVCMYGADETGVDVYFFKPKLKKRYVGNQSDLLEFLYYYRRKNTKDKAMYIYPFGCGGDNFWSTGARSKIKFAVIPDEMPSIEEIKKSNKKIGHFLHLTASGKDMISREQFNYLTYRDTDNKLYIEPWEQICPPPSPRGTIYGNFIET